MEETLYHRQAKLLLKILPLIECYPVFALKGGTAINFFLRDMPRLSVDIDFTYTPWTTGRLLLPR
jgi:predicted nucleotidyltransferase component of viral defense system